MHVCVCVCVYACVCVCVCECVSVCGVRCAPGSFEEIYVLRPLRTPASSAAACRLDRHCSAEEMSNDSTSANNQEL